jgi:hypothetical protein
MQVCEKRLIPQLMSDFGVSQSFLSTTQRTPDSLVNILGIKAGGSAALRKAKHSRKNIVPKHFAAFSSV